MDYCVLNDGKDDHFRSALKERMESLGPSVWLNRETSFSDQLASVDASTLLKPVVLVLDLGAENLKYWVEPLDNALNSRIFGGVRLPRNSSVIVLSEANRESVFRLRSTSLGWYCHLIDVHAKRLREGLSVYFKEEAIDEVMINESKEGLADFIVEDISEQRVKPNYKTRLIRSGIMGDKGLVEPDKILSRPLKERVVKKIIDWLPGSPK